MKTNVHTMPIDELMLLGRAKNRIPIAATCITSAMIGDIPIAMVNIAAIALVTSVIDSKKYVFLSVLLISSVLVALVDRVNIGLFIVFLISVICFTYIYEVD
ncbi:hypothetical protein GCM10026988_31830 [Vibrio panuliri]